MDTAMILALAFFAGVLVDMVVTFVVTFMKKCKLQKDLQDKSERKEE